MIATRAKRMAGHLHLRETDHARAGSQSSGLSFTGSSAVPFMFKYRSLLCPAARLMKKKMRGRAGRRKSSQSYVLYLYICCEEREVRRAVQIYNRRAQRTTGTG